MLTRPAAVLASVASALAALALLSLHVLRTDLSPSTHMISEYAIGPYGDVMTCSFLSFAVASASLWIALLPHARGIAGRVGLGFLLLATIGLTLGGVFAMDPTTTDQEAMSFSGRMHGVGFMLGVPGELFAVLLVSIALRRQVAWRASRLLPMAFVVWGSVVVMIPLLIHQSGFGIPNRVFMLGYALWMFLAARPFLWASSTSTPLSEAPAQS
jgi:hypothetical protein